MHEQREYGHREVRLVLAKSLRDAPSGRLYNPLELMKKTTSRGRGTENSSFSLPTSSFFLLPSSFFTNLSSN